MESNTIGWIIFSLMVFIALFLDLFVLNKKAHEIKFKTALCYSIGWIALAFLFMGVVYYLYGKKEALEFLTGYLVEESLSIDNLFVFIAIFSFFKVPAIYRHKVLFCGILGAIVMRGLFIVTEITLIY